MKVRSKLSGTMNKCFAKSASPSPIIETIGTNTQIVINPNTRKNRITPRSLPAVKSIYALTAYTPMNVIAKRHKKAYFPGKKAPANEL